MQKLIVETKKKKQVIDITERVNEILKQVQNDESTGLINLFLLHTTAAITTADLDPGTDLDMLDAFEAMMPKLNYRHPHNPGHVTDHILSSIIGASLTLPFKNGKLILGEWQRVVLIELDGPREREILVSLF